MKRVICACFALAALVLVAVGCAKKDTPNERLGVEKNYSIHRLETFRLKAGVDAEAYSWIQEAKTVDGEYIKDSVLLSEERELVKIFNRVGIYHLVVRAHIDLENSASILEHRFDVHVSEEPSRYLATPSAVLDYTPALMKYANPDFANISSPNAACIRALRSLTEGKSNLSLGCFGGSITMAFDHTVGNVPNVYDFEILRDTTYEEGRVGIVVWVAEDKNSDGKPDEWYRLSTGDKWEVMSITPYTLTYSTGSFVAPTANDAKRKFTSPQAYKWFDGTNEGFIPKVEKETAIGGKYYPAWLENEWDKIKYTGIRYEDQAVEEFDDDGEGNISNLSMTLHSRIYNNPPEGASENAYGYDIDWAVDAAGNPVKLTGIRFVKIVTGVHQCVAFEGQLAASIKQVRDLNLE